MIRGRLAWQVWDVGHCSGTKSPGLAESAVVEQAKHWQADATRRGPSQRRRAENRAGMGAQQGQRLVMASVEHERMENQICLELCGRMHIDW